MQTKSLTLMLRKFATAVGTAGNLDDIKAASAEMLKTIDSEHPELDVDTVAAQDAAYKEPTAKTK